MTISKTFARMFAACSVALLLVSPALAAPKSITIALSSDALYLDPQQQYETVTNLVCRHLYEPLVTSNADGSALEPTLAESWTLAPDNLTWTFNLRKNVTFTDGSPFTAQDVVFTVERARVLLARAQVASIKEMQIVDDHTLKITTIGPDAMLLHNLARLPIVNKVYFTRVGEAEANLKPAGTGPYVCDKWVKEDYIALSANPGYWGKKPAIGKVLFRPITNQATRTAALLTGEVDFAADIPVRDVQRVEQAKKLDLVTYPSRRVIYLHVDAHRSPTPGVALPQNPMKDLRVRQAMSMALDRKTIARVTMNQRAYATGEMVLKGMGGYLGDPVPEYNPERAKALLKEAGWGNGFTIALDAPNGRYANDAQVAQAIAGMLTKVGITVDLRLHPKTTFFDFVRPGDKSSLILTGWSENVDAVALAYVLFYTRKGIKGGSNRGHYSNADFDRLIDAAADSVDLKKRLTLSEEAMRILYHSDMGAIPLYFEQSIYAKKKNVTFVPRADLQILVQDMDI